MDVASGVLSPSTTYSFSPVTASSEVVTFVSSVVSFFVYSGSTMIGGRNLPGPGSGSRLSLLISFGVPLEWGGGNWILIATLSANAVTAASARADITNFFILTVPFS